MIDTKSQVDVASREMLNAHPGTALKNPNPLPAPQGSNVHLAFHADELAYLRARAAAEERSVPWVVRRLVREAMVVGADVRSTTADRLSETTQVEAWRDRLEAKRAKP